MYKVSGSGSWRFGLSRRAVAARECLKWLDASRSTADGLFGRATRVYRVILDEDSGRPNPPIYALKDSWRQVCRRPEIDYYDAINKYCDDPASEVDSELRASMAQCCGSIDLSTEHLEVSQP